MMHVYSGYWKHSIIRGGSPWNSTQTHNIIHRLMCTPRTFIHPVCSMNTANYRTCQAAIVIGRFHSQPATWADLWLVHSQHGHGDPQQPDLNQKNEPCVSKHRYLAAGGLAWLNRLRDSRTVSEWLDQARPGVIQAPGQTWRQTDGHNHTIKWWEGWETNIFHDN